MSKINDQILKRAITDVNWVTIAQISQRLSQFVVIAILARFLSPDDFGIVAMATVFTGFLQVFNDFGIGKATIQAKIINGNVISSCFWVNFVVSVLLFCLTLVSAPIVALFYSEPAVSDVLIVLGFSFPILGISIIHEHLLQREYNFRLVSIAEIVASIVSIIVAIILASIGYGYWALVWRILSLNLIKSLILVFSTPNIIKPKFSLIEIHDILNFSFNLLLFNTVNYFSRNADYLLIGKFLGPTELGYYSLAYRLMLMPLQSISTVVGKVLFPSLSRLQNDISKFREIILKASSMIAFFTFPIYLVLMVTSKQFIMFFLGLQWIPATIVLQILCLVGLRQSIVNFLGNIYIGLGKTKIMMVIGIFSSVINMIAIAIGLNWGIEGVALAYLVSTWCVLTYPVIKISLNLINLSIKILFRELWKSLLTSLFVAVFAFTISKLVIKIIIIKFDISFLLIIIFSGIFYLFINKILNNKQFNEIYRNVIPKKI